MILESSSGDHLDCFFAGDVVEYSRLEASLLAGTTERAVGGTGATLVAMLDEADSDNVTEAGELVEWRSASSSDLMSDEISTLKAGWDKSGKGSVRGYRSSVKLCCHAPWEC